MFLNYFVQRNATKTCIPVPLSFTPAHGTAADIGHGAGNQAVANTTISYQGTDQAVQTNITDVAGTEGVWISGGWVQEDVSVRRGVYQFCLPDAVAQANSAQVIIHIQTNVAAITDVFLCITLVDAIS